MRTAAIATGVALACAAGLSFAREGAAPWAAASGPAAGGAESIGDYSAGCLLGGSALPLSGKGFQVMRPSRQRMYGHPAMIAFIHELGARVHERGLGVVLIGDLGQPRGAPAPTGHASHQTGLDADIWYWAPKAASKRKLRRRERERLSAHPVADLASKTMTKHWSPRAGALVRLAAEDDRVARVFVNPLIKDALCRATPEDDRAWLHKVRPWWGHDAHFHVRLHCPAGSADCTPQKPIPKGDGCADLTWWLDDKAQADRATGRATYRDKIATMPALPERCADVLAAPVAD